MFTQRGGRAPRSDARCVFQHSSLSALYLHTSPNQAPTLSIQAAAAADDEDDESPVNYPLLN